ncbi:uncharacterized protein ACNS7B_003428 [Menidia menidia]
MDSDFCFRIGFPQQEQDPPAGFSGFSGLGQLQPLASTDWGERTYWFTSGDQTPTCGTSVRRGQQPTCNQRLMGSRCGCRAGPTGWVQTEGWGPTPEASLPVLLATELLRNRRSWCLSVEKASGPKQKFQAS